MEMFFAMAIKPFFALALFAAAYVLARGLAKAIPNGRIKDVLFDPSIQRRHPWKFALLAILSGWGALFVAGFITYLLR